VVKNREFKGTLFRGKRNVWRVGNTCRWEW
jgi:hypothetical protein